MANIPGITITFAIPALFSPEQLETQGGGTVEESVNLSNSSTLYTALLSQFC